MEFRITVMGEKITELAITSMGVQAKHMRPAYEEIYLTMLDIVDETFERQGARGGFPRWQKLQLDTSIRKVKRGGDPRILHSGLDHPGEPMLSKAMTEYRSPWQYTRIDNHGIVFGPKQLRGKVHMKGSRKMHIPARPFIRFTEEDKQAFSREILRHITKHLGKTGRVTLFR